MSSMAGAAGTASSAARLGRETNGGGVSSRRGEVDCEEDVDDVDVDAAEDGREVEAAPVREGEEQRESSVSDTLELSDVKDEWRVAEGIAGRDEVGSDSLRAGEMAELSDTSSTALEGGQVAVLISKQVEMTLKEREKSGGREVRAVYATGRPW